MKKDLPAQVAAGAVGDAAGEHLVMPQGKYGASHYTFIGFASLVLASTYLSSATVIAIMGAHINHDLIILLLSLSCTVVSIGLFWDRWKCNTSFCSNYCSGCANLSILYMPFVSAIYSVYRRDKVGSR